MSKFKGVRFCDGCFKSIPTGDMYYEDGKREKCYKCSKKGGWLRLALMAVVVCLFTFSGYKGFTDTHSRIDDNAMWININEHRIAHVDEITEQSFDNVKKWADSTERRLALLRVGHDVRLQMLKGSIDALGDELQRIYVLQKKLKADLATGEVSDAVVANALASLIVRADAVDSQLEVLIRSPEELIEKMVKPTVGIAVRDKTGDRLRGSGVLFKREKYKDAKTGRTRYRYYGFTAYHVWEGIFKYLEKISKPEQPPKLFERRRKLDRTMNPKLIIRYFGGQSHRAALYITNAKFVHPTGVVDYLPQSDIAVFTFTSHRGNLAIAELASDAEIRANVKYSSRVYATGIAIDGVPSLYMGATSNPKMKGNTGIAFNIFGWFGQSGGPIFDAKTLKVVSMTQRGMMPISNLSFGTLLTEFRKVWGLSAPKEYKKILDPR